jgi:hypothetical protein
MLQLLPLLLMVRPVSAGGPHAPPLPSDGSIVDLFRASGPGGGTEKNISSMWGPSLIVAGNNTVIAFGECDRSPSSHDPWMGLVRSLDGGSTWLPRQTLYGCGSPAGLYSVTTNTIFVFFGECAGAPQPPGPPYGLTEMSCAGGSVHWEYNTTTQHLRNTVISPPASPLGVKICEGGVKPIAGDGLGVGMPPDQSEPCPAADLRWKIEGPPTDFVRHVDTGLCLTIPPRKSAVLQPCGADKGEGQKFIWEASTLKLAPGMFRAGRCLGFIKKSSTWEPAAAGAAEAAAPSNLLDSGSVAAAAAAAGSAKPSKLCTVTQMLYCNSSRFRQVLEGYPRCKACLGSHAAQLKAAKCSQEQMDTFCGHPVGACDDIVLPSTTQILSCHAHRPGCAGGGRERGFKGVCERVFGRGAGVWPLPSSIFLTKMAGRSHSGRSGASGGAEWREGTAHRLERGRDEEHRRGVDLLATGAHQRHQHMGPALRRQRPRPRDRARAGWAAQRSTGDRTPLRRHQVRRRCLLALLRALQR